MSRIIPTVSQILRAVQEGRHDPAEIAKAVAQMARLKNDFIEELKQYEEEALSENARLKPIADMTEDEIKENGLRIIKALGTERAIAVWAHYSEGLTQRAVAQKAGISLGAVNTTLQDLEEAGLVKIRKRGGINPKTIKPGTYNPYRTDPK
jgi:DNA-directed RNA polymerase specialized sigma24 family protein